MRSSIVLVSAFAAAALGQNSTSYTFPAGFNIGLVKPDELSESIAFQSHMSCANNLSSRLLVHWSAQRLPGYLPERYQAKHLRPGMRYLFPSIDH